MKMLSFAKFLTEMSRGQLAKKTSSVGPFLEHGLSRMFQHYLHRRTKGENHQTAVERTFSGTQGSKGTNARVRFGRVTRGSSAVGSLAGKLGRSEVGATMRDAKFAARALAHFHDQSGAQVNAVHHLGSDNSGRKAAELAGGETKADIQLGLTSGKLGNYSLKYETAGSKSNTFKINNPGGAQLPKVIDKAHARAFRDEAGNDRRTGKPYQSPNLSQKWTDMKSDVSTLGNSVYKNPKHAETLKNIFQDPNTPVTFRRGKEGPATYNPNSRKGPILNKSGQSYLKRIAEGDRSVIPHGHPHANPHVMEAAKNLLADHAAKVKNPAAAFTGTMGSAMKEIMTGHETTWSGREGALDHSARHRDAAHTVMRALLGVPKGSADTHLVTVKRKNNELTGKQTDPTVTIHNINRAVDRHIKGVGSNGYEFNQTPGARTIRVGAVTVGFDRGSWNVQANKKAIFGDPDEIYSRNWQPWRKRR